MRGVSFSRRGGLLVCGVYLLCVLMRTARKHDKGGKAVLMQVESLF